MKNIKKWIEGNSKYLGKLLIILAVIGSNAGSVYAGIQCELMGNHPEWPAGPGLGFQIMGMTVYPICIILLILGMYFLGGDGRDGK